MLRDNIRLILSLAQQNINERRQDDDQEVIDSAGELQDTLDYVCDALSDIQEDNGGQKVIYTNVYEDKGR
jgi:hypothetical protein